MPSQSEGIAGFLRARYEEARERENAKRRTVPSVFDGHSVEWVYDRDGERLLVDDHPYPIEKWREIATEPAPDPAVLADLDAKLALLEQHVGYYGSGDDTDLPVRTLTFLALPFAAHPDYDERWRL